MKISELLKVVYEGWVRKPRGFRVRFQTRVEGSWVTDTMPDGTEALLDSDVVAWRSAWKLAEAAKSGVGEYVNITVVDDRDKPVPYYATGRVELYAPRQDVAADSPAAHGDPSGLGAEDEAGSTSGTTATEADAQPGSVEDDNDAQEGSDSTGR